MISDHSTPILQAKDVQIQFDLRGKTLTAVRGASLDLYPGESLAIVGESGSGKSVFTKSLIGMLDKNGRVTGGQVMFHGEDLFRYTTEEEWLRIRGKRIAMVFQDPMTSLNPVRTIGEQIAEVITWHFKTPHQEAKKEAIELLRKVGIQNPERRYNQYPHEFSGGMRQRVVIATAIACRPEILICDEPTTALDVTVQAQIIRLIRELQQQLQMAVIYITHDLGVVASVADKVAVFYAGQVVERGTVQEIFHQPVHPYTKALLQALPQLGVRGYELYSIQGTPPNLFKEIRGDAFAPRNPDAMEIDFEEEPPEFQVSPTHFAKTWLLHPLAAEYAKTLAERDRQKREAAANTPAPPFDYTDAEKLLEVKNLSVTFKGRGSSFKAVDNVSFDIYKGETLSLVGESGSGKTTIGRAIMRIYNDVEGDILFRGQKINGKLTKKQIRDLRMKIQMVFQDPMASLNDRAKVDYIISEGLHNYHLYENEQNRQEKVGAIMRKVGLSADFASRFPHEFSGGQRQRIGIARSLVMDPEFIVADEPISALDVSIRAQIINLLNQLRQERNLTYLFIAHDLSVVRFISDRIAVITKGRIVELADSEELFNHPLHPYTKALLSAIPYPDPDVAGKAELVTYDPSVHDYSADAPRWEQIVPGHYVLGNEAELESYRKERGV